MTSRALLAAPTSAGTSAAATIGAVVIGGITGTGLRLAVDLILPNSTVQLPLATLLVNVSGTLMLGFFAGGLWIRASTPHWFKAGIGTGLIGSFTTFSAVTVSISAQAAAGHWWLAASYLGLTLVLGLPAAGLGLWLGARTSNAPRQPEITDDGVDL